MAGVANPTPLRCCKIDSDWNSDKTLRAMTPELIHPHDAMHRRDTLTQGTSALRNVLVLVILFFAALIMGGCESEMVCPNGTDGSPCVPTENLGQAPDLPSGAMNGVDSSTSTDDAFADTSRLVIEEGRIEFLKKLRRAESSVSSVRLSGRDPPETEELVTNSTRRFLTLYRRADTPSNPSPDRMSWPPRVNVHAALLRGTIARRQHHGPCAQNPAVWLPIAAAS